MIEYFEEQLERAVAFSDDDINGLQKKEETVDDITKDKIQVGDKLLFLWLEVSKQEVKMITTFERNVEKIPYIFVDQATSIPRFREVTMWG